jgi:hypothetical protein
MICKSAFTVSLFGLCLMAALATVAAPSPASANAVQARENRTNHDRWARGNAAEKPAVADDEDDSDDQTEDKKPAKIMVSTGANAHDGELNGNLHLKGW